MDDLLFSLNTVFPLLVMMAVGFTARRVGVIGESAARQINACVFKIFLPLLLCFNIVDTQLGASTDVRTLLYAFVTTLLCFGVLFFATPRLCRDRASCGVLIQGIARSNYAIFGIPLVMMMYPRGIPPSRCSWWRWWCRCSTCFPPLRSWCLPVRRDRPGAS